jgi:hypothetical protein
MRILIITGDSVEDYENMVPFQVLLSFIKSRGAECPAGHNVGHLYEAKPALKQHYQVLVPTNTFNAGIGKTSKNKVYTSVDSD